MQLLLYYYYIYIELWLPQATTTTYMAGKVEVGVVSKVDNGWFITDSSSEVNVNGIVIC